MFDFSQVTLNQIAVHKIGNKGKDEALVCSKAPLHITDEAIGELLLKYFLSPFKEEVFFNFSHSSDINLNEVYHYAEDVFENGSSLYIQSVNIAKHLFEQSLHPKIKEGELYVVHFNDCVINGETTDAIGIFKSENKDTYLKVFEQKDGFEIEQQQGVNINKLDKGCLIFNTDKENGYTVCMVDAQSKLGEAQYWKDDFLKIKPTENNYYHTQNYLKLCKSFCNEVLTEKNEVTKKDQLMVMDNAVSYFARNESFNEHDFAEETLVEPKVIEAFKMFKTKYQDQHSIETADEFDISAQALKSVKKIHKSIIKLDKNFHVYIHGSHDFIERGYDPNRQMNYYQLFFTSES